MKSYLVIYEKSSTGYSAYVPDLPGCLSTGAGKEEAKRNSQAAISLHLEVMIEDGLTIPESSSEAETVTLPRIPESYSGSSNTMAGFRSGSAAVIGFANTHTSLAT